jgi:hypothetical protein
MFPSAPTTVACSATGCTSPAAFSLHLNDVYHGCERYHAPLNAAFCTQHALENEISAHGDLPGPRCYRIYPLITSRCERSLNVRLNTSGWISYRLLPAADLDAKRAARLLPKKPKVAWRPILPRDVAAMRKLLRTIGGAR